MKKLLWNLLAIAFVPVFVLAALMPSTRRRVMFWGKDPIINNKYWSAAVRELGHDSMTVMEGFYHINTASDFDRYFADYAPAWLPRAARNGLGSCLAMIHILRRARVVHIAYTGFAIGSTALWRLEYWLWRLAGIKVVVLAYGADGYLYSRLIDTSLRYGLLASYPAMARREEEIAARVRFWSRHADAIAVGPVVDGIGRWDVTMNSILTVDVEEWQPKRSYSRNDGINGPVRILHCPNHRGFKGTEFLIDAAAQLKAEGWLIDLVLLERVPNQTVRAAMQEVDILAEQFIATAYGLNGVEGMASGLPVLANLDHEAYTRVFRRYGFLGECPVLSTPPERLVENLRHLVRNPDLREELGRAGRAYVTKYHSYAMARYLFGAIYAKILDGEDVALIDLFHPLKSAYNSLSPRVEHPLIDSRIPADLLARLTPDQPAR